MGRTLASKLVGRGARVALGARDARNEKAAAWAREAGPDASHGTFASAAAAGEIVFNCTLGSATLEALSAAGADALAGKVLIDVSNPLAFPSGRAPEVFTTPNESLGERIQEAFPRTRVVKALSTVNGHVMADATRVADGDHHLLVCGNDAAAKADACAVLREHFDCKEVIDLGDITGARAMEGYVALWIRLRLALGTSDFNVKVVTAR